MFAGDYVLEPRVVLVAASKSAAAASSGKGFDPGGGGSPGSMRARGGIYIGTPCSYRCLESGVSTSARGCQPRRSTASEEARTIERESGVHGGLHHIKRV